MGEIIDLNGKHRERRREIAAPAPASAQILFFTGVRYEKYADSAQMVKWVEPADEAGPANNNRRRSRRA